MLSRFTFYITYAFRNLRRNLRWTIFAIFCIAAGVAAVVALRSLGLAIGDSLIENARSSNKGDISISLNDSSGFGGLGDGGEQQSFSAREVEIARSFAEERGGTITLYSTLPSLQLTELEGTNAGRPQFVSGFVIDPTTFPPTGDILATDPVGVPLRDLIVGDHDVIISQNLADQQNLAVGAQVRASRTTELFTVRGIVATENEASFNNLFASFFGFAYFPESAGTILGAPTQPNAMAITLPRGTDLGQARSDLYRLGIRAPIVTLDDVLARNQTIADVLGRFIVVMGLGALLIGGVGNINTMLVLVGRRTNEIAAMKTFGLKGRQISLLFLSEAFLLGLLGSVVGCILGTLLSFAVNRYGETFLNQRLAFAVYPEALLFGMVLGLIVSMVFGVLPVMIANKVRPAAVLRPNETQIPRAGCIQTIGMLLLVVLVIGAVAGQILGSIPIGIIGVAVTLTLLGVLVGLMWVVVWLVSRLPSFGSVDLRLALRNLSSRRLRTATTMLALAAGMFALSAITFIGVGTREVLQFQLVNQLGGNVLVFPVIGVAFDNLAQGLLNTQLNGIDGILSRSRVSTYTGQLVGIDGLEPAVAFPFSDQLPPRAQRGLTSVAVQTRETTGEAMPSSIIEGRVLTAEDAGTRVIVVSQSAADAQVTRVGEDGTETVEPYTIGIGSVITLRFGDQRVDYTVVGIEQSANASITPGGSGVYSVPPGSVPRPASFSFNVLNVQPDRLNDVLLSLSVLPFTLSLDITFIDGLIGRLITQFSAIPTVVGLLSLLAAAVTMANTVSLAVLERRRSIGVLKAIGLKSRRVLWVLLLENTIVGLLGGLLGIGFSALTVAIITALGQGTAIPIPRDAAPVAIALIIAAVAIAWIATFLSARPAANEKVANVLRYE